jgi:hypothetical protein
MEVQISAVVSSWVMLIAISIAAFFIKHNNYWMDVLQVLDISEQNWPHLTNSIQIGTSCNPFERPISELVAEKDWCDIMRNTGVILCVGSRHVSVMIYVQARGWNSSSNQNSTTRFSSKPAFREQDWRIH